MARETRSDCHAKESQCLARSVAEALGREPGLEAVTIDLDRKAISVATLGRAEDSALSERIAGTVREAQEHPEAERCCLAGGAGSLRDL